MIKRKSFAKLKEVYGLPNLLDVQLESYREFLQLDVSARSRRHQGLQEVFAEVFPLEIDYPQLSIDNVGDRGATYGMPGATHDGWDVMRAVGAVRSPRAAGSICETSGPIRPTPTFPRARERPSNVSTGIPKPAALKRD